MDEKLKTISKWLGSGSINLFGRPFSGKDTQGARLVEMINAQMVGSGEILRSHPEQTAIQDAMASGGIVPSQMYLDLVLPYLSSDKFTDSPLILDEVGRAKGEESAIMSAAEGSAHPIKAVVLIKVSDEEVWRRFEASQAKHDRGDRQDDNASVLQNRLDKYQEKVMPVIDFYRQADLLVEVNGEQPKDAVTEAIITALLAKADLNPL